jgi:hypothetical protein
MPPRALLLLPGLLGVALQPSSAQSLHPFDSDPDLKAACHHPPAELLPLQPFDRIKPTEGLRHSVAGADIVHTTFVASAQAHPFLAIRRSSVQGSDRVDAFDDFTCSALPHAP